MRESLRFLAAEDQYIFSGGMRKATVELLNGELIHIEIERKAKGSELLDIICDHLGITETDYFGFLYELRTDNRVWVDLNKKLSKTFRNDPWDVRFAVKFYPPEPSEVEDEIARDQLHLAIKRDINEGRLTCSFVTYCLLASYTLQSVVGDVGEEGGEGREGASLREEVQVSPPHVCGAGLEGKVGELWKLHRGQTPSEAVLNYLENAKKLPLYGSEQHTAVDSENVLITISVNGTGISIYRDELQMNRFPWPKITKLSYNKRNFTLKLRPSEFEEFESNVTFLLPSTRSCKKLWTCAVERHVFYRREAPLRVSRVPLVPWLGSRRLSCRRTLRQLRNDVLGIPRTEITAT